jgi:type I restriction enzyme S subunit
MASEWRECRLEDIAAPSRNALVGGPFGSDLVSSDYVPSGVPVIRGENVSLGRWVAGDFAFVSAEKAVRLAANTAGPLDLVFTQRGANHYRQVALVPAMAPERFLISQSQMKLTVDPSAADPLFIYYLMRAPEQQAYLQRNAIQTGVPHTNLSILRRMPIRIPPLSQQRRIAAELGALDDKIELNRRVSQTLESMARALFKSWFVDFDPVRAKAEGRDSELPSHLADLLPSSFADSELGEIPSGWRVCGLDEIADFLNGLALQRFPPRGGRALPVIKIAQLHAGNTDGADEASADIPNGYIIKDGDVLFSWSGSLAVELWCGGRGALNQHLFKVTSDRYPKWFYYLWTSEHLANFREIAAGKATTMGHIQRGHMTAARVLVPPEALLDGMSGSIEPLIEACATARFNSRLVAALRDGLLPRLITGGPAVLGQDAPSIGEG